MKKKFLGLVLIALLATGCATSHLENGKESVVTFNEGGISAEDLYNVLKEKYGTTEMITLIDTELLSREYKETSDETKYIKDVIASLKSSYGDNFESAIQNYYGVTDEKEFEEYVRLAYRRQLWEKDYAKSEVTDTEINDYYETTAIGDIEASHILIKVNSNEDDEKALQTAKDIIAKLDKGEDFAALAKEYSEDAANAEKGGSLGYFNYKDNFDKNFMEAAVKLEVGAYTKTPVKSQFGYHIIYKTNQKEKDTLENLKDGIIEIIANEKIDANESYMAKALVELRSKYGMKITDSNLSEGYNKLYNE